MPYSSVADGSFPLTAAQLSGNFVETLFFGMYLVTCTFCFRVLLLTGHGADERWRQLHEIKWMMLIIAVTLFAICTFDVAIGLLHNFHAFVESNDPEKEFQNIADWINITRTATNTIAMIIGDYVLIYRCWIVHGRRWLVIVPSVVMELGSIAVTAGQLQVEGNPKTDESITLNSRQVRPWFIAFFAIATVQNLVTTSLLIYRIWRVEKDSERFINESGSWRRQPHHLRKVIRVIAESGAVYTFMVFMTFIVGVIQSNAMYPTSDITLQMTGIVFNVILVRSSASRDQQFTAFDKNQRTTILAQSTIGGSVLGSNQLHLKSWQNRTHDIELAVKNDHDDHEQFRAGQADEHHDPVGIKVTKSIIVS